MTVPPGRRAEAREQYLSGPCGAAAQHSPSEPEAQIKSGTTPGPAGKWSQYRTVSTDGAEAAGPRSHQERGPGGAPAGGGKRTAGICLPGSSEVSPLLLVVKHTQRRGGWWSESLEGQGHWGGEGQHGESVAALWREVGAYLTILMTSPAASVLNPGSALWADRPPAFPEPLGL